MIQSGHGAQGPPSRAGGARGEPDGLPPRDFPNFHAAAEEAAISRLYGGIHFRAAIKNGLTQGACVGEHVNRLVTLK